MYRFAHRELGKHGQHRRQLRGRGTQPSLDLVKGALLTSADGHIHLFFMAYWRAIPLCGIGMAKITNKTRQRIDISTIQ
jgi:hypothetical protein